ncbi:MAG: helix-turn-helix domain-containing protein [Hyphomicrobiales bacterium]|nr:helix-turn-helix domain-containing protein [Hyphomicrobiales bacterium]
MVSLNDKSGLGDASVNSVVAGLCASPEGCRSVCATCRVRLYAVCSAMSEDDIADLERLAAHVELSPRTALFQAGDLARFVYTVTSGTLRLQRDLADGRRQVIGFAIPGDFIGLSLDETYQFSADTLTAVGLCRFDRKDFTSLSHSRQPLLERLHLAATHELTIAQDHMVILGRRRAEERVAAFLLRWRDRLGRINGRSATVGLPMSRQDMADHLGLTIETVSRTMARWMRDRIILDVPGGIRVLDQQRLAAILPD